MSRNNQLVALHKGVVLRAALARGCAVFDAVAVVKSNAVIAALAVWRAPLIGSRNTPPIMAIASARAAASPSALLLAVWSLVLTAGKARMLSLPLSPLAAPAYVRFLASAVAAVGGLAGTAALSLFIVKPQSADAVSVELAALSASECMILAILSAVIIALPLNVMILMGLRKAAVADSHLRFPELARAANIRSAFAVALAGAPTSLLVAAIAIIGGVLREPLRGARQTANAAITAFDFTTVASKTPEPPRARAARNATALYNAAS